MNLSSSRPSKPVVGGSNPSGRATAAHDILDLAHEVQELRLQLLLVLDGPDDADLAEDVRADLMATDAALALAGVA